MNLDRGNPPIAWLGLAAPEDQIQDDRFSVFVDPQHGIRAAIINMQTHALRATGSYCMGLQALVTLWAPPVENDTLRYLDSVATRIGCKPDTLIDLHDQSMVSMLVIAFIIHENGRCIYPAEILQGAMNLMPDLWIKQTIDA